MPGLRPRALVTGASRGIGRHTALALARAGFDVAITGRTLVEGEGRVAPRTSPDGDDGALLPVPGSLPSTAAEVEALGAACLPLAMDLSDAASVRATADRLLAEWGVVDVVVNNAYVHLPHQRLPDLDTDALRRTWEGNFLHQVLLVQALLPGMVERGRGLVADMASSSATTDPPRPPGDGGWGLAYAASKASFGRIAGAVNAEYWDRGVRAFNVDPGFVVTESAEVRGGNTKIAEGGFPPADPAASGAVIAWLFDNPDAERYRGKVIWATKLAAEIASSTQEAR